MKKLNNNGEFIMAVMIWQIVAGLLVASSQLPVVKDNFRTRKAVERCIKDTNNSTCVDYVASLTKKERIEYIRDTQENPRESEITIAKQNFRSR